ncbi:MAG: hypothetical protein ACH350_02380 [Parachlamydiaceae bacterium]
MSHCQDYSCGSEKSSETEPKNCSCPCHQSESGCQPHQGSCGESHQGHHAQSGSCDYAKKFLEIADQAWMEVLKEKIKENIRSKACNMDELARLISEANHERWRMKMENKHAVNEYEAKIRNFFNHTCDAQKPKH